MKEFFRYYSKYQQMLKGSRLQHFLAVITLILLLFITNYSTYQIKWIIEDIQAGNDITRSLLILAFVVSLPMVIEPITHTLRNRLHTKLSSKLYRDIYKNVMNLDVKYHVNKESGKVVSKLIVADQYIRTFLWDFEFFFFENLAGFIIPLIIVGTLNLEIGLITILALISVVPLQVWALRINVKRRNAVKQIDYERNSAIVDTVSNFETVRLFSNVSEEESFFGNLMKSWQERDAAYRSSFRFVDFTARLGGLLVFFAGAITAYYYYTSNVISTSVFIVILTYLLSLTNRSFGLMFSLKNLTINLPIIEDLYELLNKKSEMIEPEQPVKLHIPDGDIKFNNITFHYSENSHKNIFEDVNIHIEPEQTVAFVGPSGGGKSTLIKLLLRYYDVDNGEVLIDGVDVRELGTSEVNRIIGVVPQEPVLFNKSIKYNIGYALGTSEKCLNENFDVIINAAKRANIHDFITSLPDGYETVVGERGVKLSGGQKQRIAIARVLVKNPKIVVFDEATSMLDSESEKAIQSAFKELSKKTTTIVIAHRLSTIVQSDKIFVIDSGKVVESGKHDELLKLNGVYANLWNIQSGSFKKG